MRGTAKGNHRPEKGENIPGWRKGRGVPATSIQQKPQRNLSGSEGKVQRPGRARPRAGAPPATLTQAKPATPSTTSSVRSSKAARPSGSCLGTWTMSQPKPPQAERERRGLARRATETNPWLRLGQGLVARKCMQFRILHQEQGGRKGAGGEQEGRETREKEACLDELPSSFPSPSPEVGCPTLPKVQCRVTAGRG